MSSYMLKISLRCTKAQKQMVATLLDIDKSS